MEPEAIKALAEAVKGQDSVWVTVLIGLLGLIVVAHRFGLFAFLRDKTTVQAESFQDKLLKALDAAAARETAFGLKIDGLEAENDKLRDEVRQARFELHMMRRQLRLLIEGMRLFKEGKLAFDLLPLPEIDLGKAT